MTGDLWALPQGKEGGEMGSLLTGWGGGVSTGKPGPSRPLGSPLPPLCLARQGRAIVTARPVGERFVTDTTLQCNTVGSLEGGVWGGRTPPKKGFKKRELFMYRTPILQKSGRVLSTTDEEEEDMMHRRYNEEPKRFHFCCCCFFTPKNKNKKEKREKKPRKKIIL